MASYALQYWTYSICLLITLAVFVVAVSKPPSHEQKLVLVITFFIFTIMFGYWGAVNGKIVSPDLLIFVTKIQYIGACNIFAVLTLLFARIFNLKLPKPIVRSQLALSILMTLIAASFDKHTLFFSSYHVELINGMSVLIKRYGVFHVLYLVLMTLYVLFFAIISLRVAIKGSKHNKKMAANLLFPFLFLGIFSPDLSILVRQRPL